MGFYIYIYCKKISTICIYCKKSVYIYIVRKDLLYMYIVRNVFIYILWEMSLYIYIKKKVTIYICIVPLFLLLVGGRNPYVRNDAFLGVPVILPYWTPHLSRGWIAYVIVEQTK